MEISYVVLLLGLTLSNYSDIFLNCKTAILSEIEADDLLPNYFLNVHKAQAIHHLTLSSYLHYCILVLRYQVSRSPLSKGGLGGILTRVPDSQRCLKSP
jgi:hypothetical protein